MINETENSQIHSALIKALAEGSVIQVYDENEDKWFDCCGLPASFLDREDKSTIQYRIKQSEPGYDEKYFYVECDGTVAQMHWMKYRAEYARLAVGNLFLCKEEAEDAAERVKAAFKGNESEEIDKLRKENKHLKKEIAEYEKKLEAHGQILDILKPISNEPISKGESALIHALREAKVAFVYGSNEAVIIDKNLDANYDTVSFLTSEDAESDMEVRNALNLIKEEQEQGAIINSKWNEVLT